MVLEQHQKEQRQATDPWEPPETETQSGNLVEVSG